ncbi:hypothetical protein BACIT_3612 [Bacillus amyloliquefaciens]|nr:hypothetical protein BACIT_3612 [Bacillus amyloliquefaciens]
MKRKLTICLLLALMCFITTAKAEDEGGLKELNDLSDTVFQMTRHSQYDEALQVLGYFKKKIDTRKLTERRRSQAGDSGFQ